MLYIRLCLDKPNSNDLRKAKRDEHRAYLRNQPLHLVQAGPLYVSDTQDEYMASFMIIEAENRDEVMDFHEKDPFTQAGLFDQVHIHRWDKHIG